MTANEIRESYKKFFESKGHTIVPSAPMVVKDDPTLMFTNGKISSSARVIQNRAVVQTHRSVCA